MKSIVQSKTHVAFQFTWSEIVMLAEMLDSWKWAVERKRLGGTSAEHKFATEFLDMVNGAVDRREIIHHQGKL